jgi:hypothetical protein
LQRPDSSKWRSRRAKAIYCEKPTAVNVRRSAAAGPLCEKPGLKNGVVQDKLWLPGLRKIQMLREQGFFGKILSVRGEFGYWVFTGHVPNSRPAAELELPPADGGGNHRGYVLPLALRDRKSFRADQIAGGHGATDIPEANRRIGPPVSGDGR